ncbi:MAG: hypothetical protein AAF242_17750, partial [Bacteroidota bacterium]
LWSSGRSERAISIALVSFHELNISDSTLRNKMGYWRKQMKEPADDSFENRINRILPHLSDWPLAIQVAEKQLIKLLA